MTSMKVFAVTFFMFLLIGIPSQTHAAPNNVQLSYYMNIQDLVDSFIEIPTSNVSFSSTTIASKLLAGNAPVFNGFNQQVGTCSASFLSIQNVDGIFTDISNHLSVDNGLILSWSTPAKPANLQLDTLVQSMASESTVTASTKVGTSSLYRETFNLVVTSDSSKVYFNLESVPEPTPTPDVDPADLVVTGLSAQKQRDGKFLCGFRVTNNGTKTTPASKATITRFKTKNPRTGQGTLIKTVTIPALAAGAASPRFQARANQGTAKFCVVDLDTTSVVVEADESNNRQARKIQ